MGSFFRAGCMPMHGGSAEGGEGRGVALPADKRGTSLPVFGDDYDKRPLGTERKERNNSSGGFVLYSLRCGVFLRLVKLHNTRRK